MRRRRLMAVTLFLVMAWTLGAKAADPARASPTDQLEQIKSRIDALRHKLEAAQGRKQRVEDELRRYETDIAELSSGLERLRKDIAQDRQRLAALQAERRAAEAALTRLRDTLARHIRAAYILGRQQQTRIVLNQHDPAAIGRTFTYYDYLTRARVEALAEIQVRVRELESLGRNVMENAAVLEQRLAEETAQKAALEAIRVRRAEALAALNQDIHAKGTALAGLRDDQRRLERLVETLDRSAGATPPGPALPFAKSKGKLLRPVAGRVLARYGSARAEGGRLKWRGVLFKAAEGASVRAVAPGRVVFADWLRGFGFLVIVNHGDEYMSLYGHNQSLAVKTGDMLEAGTIVAAVGTSGGQAAPGLYFEIRHKGVPTNPMPWFASKRD